MHSNFLKNGTPHLNRNNTIVQNKNQCEFLT